MVYQFLPKYDITIVTTDDRRYRTYSNITRYDKNIVKDGILQKHLKKYLNNKFGEHTSILRVKLSYDLLIKIYLKLDILKFSDYALGLYKIDSTSFLNNIVDDINNEICYILNVDNKIDWVER